MRYLIAIVCIVVLLPSFALAENKPNPSFTPGEVVTTSLSLVCQKGYSKSVRRTTRDMKKKVYNLYGIKKRSHYKIDHLVPLCIGGADTIANIWPSNHQAEKYNADAKDRLELKILHLVCGKKMDIKQGQKLFMTDWTVAYDKYCSGSDDCPSYEEIRQNRIIYPDYKPYK